MTAWTASVVSGEGNVLTGGDFGTIYIRSSPRFTNFRNNHILNAGSYSVICDNYIPPPDHYVNLSHNYWGTNDPEQISEWIYDGYDSDQIHNYVIFKPFLGDPVGTESATWSELKSMYR